MRKILALAISAAAVFGPGLAMAGDEEATIPLSDTPAGLEDVYVDADGPGLWQESNGCAGLQTTEIDCDGNEENGTEPADSNLLADAPAPPEAPEVPVP